MLLFIGWSTWEASAWKNFNTSHVTVYRSRELNTPLFLLISIHLMLLFIAFFRLDQVTCLNFNIVISHRNLTLPFLFQYISCYCLSSLSLCAWSPFCISIHLMLLFIKFSYHGMTFYKVFQYISCYCLSYNRYQVSD